MTAAAQVYYKILNSEKNTYWMQNKYGYTADEKEAGWWSNDEIKCMQLDAYQRLVPFEPSVIALRLRNIQSFNELKKIADGFREK